MLTHALDNTGPQSADLSANWLQLFTLLISVHSNPLFSLVMRDMCRWEVLVTLISFPKADLYVCLLLFLSLVVDTAHVATSIVHYIYDSQY
jgi:hypothetical protein